MMILQEHQKRLEIENRVEIIRRYEDTPSLQRLKGIGYFCGMEYASKDIYHFTEYFSRFDHSINTALITSKYTKDKKQILGALYHDVASPCFSHVIDYMNKDYETQESTEEYTEWILKRDKKFLAQLKEDNLQIEDILNYKNYSIVDIKRPKLCADRIEGICSNALFWTQALTLEEVQRILESTEKYKNEEGNEELGFSEQEALNLALRANQKWNSLCHGKEDKYMMQKLADITSMAIERGVFSYQDLYMMTEQEIMGLLMQSNEKEILENLSVFQTIKKSEIPTINLPKIKIRKLNPLLNGTRVKL